MEPSRPRVIDFLDLSDSAKSDRREWAHRWLDGFLDARDAWQSMPADDFPNLPPNSLPFQGPRIGEAINLFTEAMGFASILTGGDLREAVAPTYTLGEPDEMRQALIRSIELIRAVWPSRSKSLQFSPQPIWWSDVVEWIEMLNNGQTPAIFERPKGAGSFNWTEKRFRFLAALWATHVEFSKDWKREASNNFVAIAFDPSIGQETTESGRLSQGQIPRWRKWVDDVACYKVRDTAVTAALAQSGLRLALTKPKSEHNAREIALGLYHVTFGAMANGADTLREAGERFQRHREIRALDPQTERQRKRRADKASEA